MDDKKLHTLRNINPPTPSDGAKKAAIHAAMQAFEAVESEKMQKNATFFQGFQNTLRLIHSFNQELWRFIMKKQLLAGTIFASGLTLAITTGLLQSGKITLDTPSTTTALVGTEITVPTGNTAKQPIILMDDSKIAAVKENRSAPVVSKDKEQVVTRNEIDGIIGQIAKNVETTAGIKAERELNTGQADAVAPLAEEQVVRQVARKRMDANVVAAAPAMMAQGKAQLFGGLTRSLESVAMPSVAMGDMIAPQPEYEGRDKFEELTTNPVKQVSDEPVSTFSVDVDTAAYAFVRKSLNNGVLPQKDAVRLEEMINYFDYDYALPEKAEQPFKPTVAVYPTPWNPNTKLLHIGIKGHDIIPTEKPKSNLVFLLDVSGSMSSQDKLPLLKNAFKLMVENLNGDDTVSIVTYAGRAGTVLEPTKVAEKGKILRALDNLNSGGSTAGAQGIKQAYALAEENFDKEGVNRVILATDGDFNVGITNQEELKGFIERKRESGIFLSVLGFGRGNYNDALMQTLAQNGNGNAAYIDTLNEARKVLVDEASSTLFPIAKDVKIQIEFNPKTVAEYRLIGYETRMLNREDFNNDKVDAGDIGSGHTVTAIYEITPVGSESRLIDDLRYQQKVAVEKPVATDATSEYAFLKLRYKLPNENTSKLIELPVDKSVEKESIDATSTDIRFAASVAAFGQLLRGDSYTGDFSYDDVINLAQGARGTDAFGYRAEFLNLVRLAKSAGDM